METLTTSDTIPVKLYMERSDLISESLAKTIHLTKDEDILPDYGLARYHFNGLKVYAFASHLTEGAPMILAPMFIPRYFDQIPELDPGVKTDIHGLFLFRLGATLSDAQAFISDHQHGDNGCPERILIDILLEYFFTFNGMRFYPFLQTDYTVGYYVCDGGAHGSKAPRAWPRYSADEIGVAVDYPITYDATLGIYMTRAAHVVRA